MCLCEGLSSINNDHHFSRQQSYTVLAFKDDNDPLFTAINQSNDERHSFLTENYDHENLMINHQSQSRTSVSARFRSVSKGITYDMIRI